MRHDQIQNQNVDVVLPDFFHCLDPVFRGKYHFHVLLTAEKILQSLAEILIIINYTQLYFPHTIYLLGTFFKNIHFLVI